ncbi:MAG: hypothetical protein CL434_14200 [Acidimicrobiaceae bacterium]|nr:hypothetical protein [Acidimicrobiaceae bacterium]
MYPLTPFQQPDVANVQGRLGSIQSSGGQVQADVLQEVEGDPLAVDLKARADEELGSAAGDQ